MLKMRLFLALLFFVIKTPTIFACSCYGPITFCQTLTETYDQSEFSIVVGKRGNLQQEYIDFHIEKTLFGNPLLNKIKIEFGYGADCRVGTQYWDVDLEYILILTTPQSGDIYSLSICSYSVLTLDNGMVTGLIDQEIEQTIPYSEFLQSLECFDGDLNYLDISVHQISEGQMVFTNLTNLQTDVLAEIVDVSGRKIFSCQIRFEANGRQFIDLPNDIPNGIYILVFSRDGLKQSQKIFL